MNTFLVGGIEKVLIELLENIDKDKFNIKLLIGYNLQELEILKEDIPQNVEIKHLINEEFLIKGKKKKSSGKMKNYEKILDESLSWIRKILLKRRLLHYIKNDEIIIDFDMTLAPYSKKLKENYKKIITFCHFSFKNYNRGIESRQKKLGKRLMNYNRILVISDEMKKEGEEIYPFLKEKFFRIYNSFDFNKIREKSLQENTIKQKEYLKDNYIVAVGRLEETQKDFTTLIEAYALVESKIKEKLFIIGEGRHRKELENLVKKLKIEEKVLFMGYQSNPFPWIKNSNLFVHSSKFEGLPTVLIEAMILERPIIATDCPTGPKEILENGKSGILVSIGNKKELAEKIEKILLNQNFKNEIVENSKKNIKRFDSKIIIELFENEIMSVINDRE
ncbi:glycosyltransferase [Fusobacterium ulcerans]|uniref:glycosyltransferase n=2 Tax=Fusobacterium TaxID=848 RepID=UPI0030CEA9DF